MRGLHNRDAKVDRVACAKSALRSSAVPTNRTIQRRYNVQLRLIGFLGLGFWGLSKDRRTRWQLRTHQSTSTRLFACCVPLSAQIGPKKLLYCFSWRQLV